MLAPAIHTGAYARARMSERLVCFTEVEHHLSKANELDDQIWNVLLHYIMQYAPLRLAVIYRCIYMYILYYIYSNGTPQRRVGGAPPSILPQFSLMWSLECIRPFDAVVFSIFPPPCFELWEKQPYKGM